MDVRTNGGTEESTLAGGGAVGEDVVDLGEEGGLLSSPIAAVTVLLIVTATATAFPVTAMGLIRGGGGAGVVLEQLVDLIQHHHPHCE